MSRELLLPEESRRILAKHLYDEKLFGIKENPNDYITLKSGRLSPHYLDIRKGIASFATRKLVATSLVSLARHHSVKGNLREAYDYIVGTPEAMTTYGGTIGDVAGMGVLQPRANMAKTTGNKSPILGAYTEGDRVAAFDDVITDGASKIETVEQLGKAGLVVADYFIVMDRQEGGTAQVKEATGLDVVPALTVQETTRLLYTDGVISTTQYNNVAEYLSQYGDSSVV